MSHEVGSIGDFKIGDLVSLRKSSTKLKRFNWVDSSWVGIIVGIGKILPHRPIMENVVIVTFQHIPLKGYKFKLKRLKRLIRKRKKSL